MFIKPSKSPIDTETVVKMLGFDTYKVLLTVRGQKSENTSQCATLNPQSIKLEKQIHLYTLGTDT